MHAMAGLGSVLNVIPTASGVDIPLTQAGAVTFVCVDAGSGDQTVTLTQTDSTGVNSEIDLDEADNVYAHNGPDTGGTWTVQSVTADQNVVTNTGGATNDTLVFTVRASQLADGYDRVQATANSGTCVAIVHDLHVMRKPSNLKSNLTA